LLNLPLIFSLNELIFIAAKGIIVINMDFNTLLPTLEHLNYLGYWLVLLAAFLESVAFVGAIFPGSAVVVLMGFLASRGLFHIGDLIWFATAGAILGDGLSYYLGKRGFKFFRRHAGFLLKDVYLEKGEKFFKDHGGKSVFLGRFVAGIRTVIPFVAGMVKMEARQFFFWNILSAFLWSISHLLVGYFFGEAWNVIETWSSRIGIALVLIGVGVAIIYFVRKIIIAEGNEFMALAKSIWSSIKEAIVANPEVKKFGSRHPLFFRTIKNRLDYKKFSGLPLTSLSLIFFYFFFHFVGTVRDIIAADPVVQVDVRLENLLYVFRYPLLTEIFFWITLFAQWEVIVFLTLIFSLVIWLWRQPRYLIPFWITTAAASGSTVLGKLAIHRPRPIGVAVFIEQSYSFPSGHATMVVALYGFIAYFLFRQLQGWKSRINILFFSTLIILLVGLSRLYLGAHYLSDVIGGYFLGVMWLLVGISLAEWQLYRNHKEEKCEFNFRFKVITASLLLILMVSFITFGLIYQPLLNTNLAIETTKTIDADKVLVQFSGDSALPKYSEKLDGTTQEPMSFIIIASSDAVLKNDLAQAGWQTADPVSVVSVLQLAKAALNNESYPTAPMTPSFWNTAVNDFNFEKQTADDSARSRHHARFWKTALAFKNGQSIYIGTASLDEGVKWLITHKINPDLDSEREALFNDLKNAGLVIKSVKQPFVPAQLGQNTLGDLFFTDGYLYFINLK